MFLNFIIIVLNVSAAESEEEVMLVHWNKQDQQTGLEHGPGHRTLTGDKIAPSNRKDSPFCATLDQQQHKQTRIPTSVFLLST